MYRMSLRSPSSTLLSKRRSLLRKRASLPTQRCTLSQQASPLAEQGGRRGSQAHPLHGPENGQSLIPQSDSSGCRCCISFTLFRTGRAYPPRGLFLAGLQIFSKVSFWVSQIHPSAHQAGPPEELFPLDRARGFGADVVYHPRHAAHFIDD